jgi:pimeloyl-ACP methyl ester carboxylesterase
LEVYEENKEDEYVIIVHGTMTDPSYFKGLVRELLKVRINAVIVHLVGHGKSPGLNRPFCFNDMKQNIKDAITWSIGRYNKRPHLTGTSQGGFLAAAVAAEDGRIKSVYPHGIMLPKLNASIMVTRYPASLAGFTPAIRKVLDLSSRLFPSMPIPYRFYIDPKRIGSERMVSVMDDMKYYPLWHVSSLFNADMSGLEKGLKCPVGVIELEKETLFPKEYIEMVYKRLNAPVKRIFRIDSETHSAFFLEPKKIVDSIEPMIREFA